MGTKPSGVMVPLLPKGNTPIRPSGGNNHRGSRRAVSYVILDEELIVADFACD